MRHDAVIVCRHQRDGRFVRRLEQLDEARLVGAVAERLLMYPPDRFGVLGRRAAYLDAGRFLSHEKPRTGWGTYGSSSAAISSEESVSDSAATASSRWCGLVAPTIGAVITGLESIHASATCAIGTPRSSVIRLTCSTTRRSASSVRL